MVVAVAVAAAWVAVVVVAVDVATAVVVVLVVVAAVVVSVVVVGGGSNSGRGRCRGSSSGGRKSRTASRIGITWIGATSSGRWQHVCQSTELKAILCFLEEGGLVYLWRDVQSFDSVLLLLRISKGVQRSSCLLLAYDAHLHEVCQIENSLGFTNCA